MKKGFVALLLSFSLCALVACGSSQQQDVSDGENVEGAENVEDGEQEDEGTIATSFSAEYPSYATANDLVETADLVFSGTVKGISYEDLDVRVGSGEDSATGISSSGNIPYTIYEIDVDTVYKGTAEEDVVRIKVPGGEKDGKLYIADGAPKISEGEEYLFLAETYENTYPSLLNLSQSTYDLDAAEAQDEGSDKITLSEIMELLG